MKILNEQFNLSLPDGSHERIEETTHQVISFLGKQHRAVSSREKCAETEEHSEHQDMQLAKALGLRTLDDTSPTTGCAYHAHAIPPQIGPSSRSIVGVSRSMAFGPREPSAHLGVRRWSTSDITLTVRGVHFFVQVHFCPALSR